MQRSDKVLLRFGMEGSPSPQFSVKVEKEDVYSVADPGGGQIRPWPPIEVGNGVWPPRGEERITIAL